MYFLLRQTLKVITASRQLKRDEQNNSKRHAIVSSFIVANSTNTASPTLLQLRKANTKVSGAAVVPAIDGDAEKDTFFVPSPRGIAHPSSTATTSNAGSTTPPDDDAAATPESKTNASSAEKDNDIEQHAPLRSTYSWSGKIAKEGDKAFGSFRTTKEAKQKKPTNQKLDRAKSFFSNNDYNDVNISGARRYKALPVWLMWTYVVSAVILCGFCFVRIGMTTCITKPEHWIAQVNKRHPLDTVTCTHRALCLKYTAYPHNCTCMTSCK